MKTPPTWSTNEVATAVLIEPRREVESALRRSMDGLAARVPPVIAAAARDGALGGGKRMRPLLLLASYEDLGGAPVTPVFDLAAAVELIHAYSLMHDDLPCMDDAPLRRGRPTAHVVHGTATTARAGVALIAWAAICAREASLALGGSEAQARQITATLLEAAGAGGMVGGQALDLLSENVALSEPELARLHTLKSGALLTVSLEMGAMAAGAEARQLAAVRRFGADLGLAFQIADDVLDATSNTATLGKRPSDMQRNKSTYVALLGVEGARARAQSLVDGASAHLEEEGIGAPRLRRLAHFVVSRQS